MREWIAAPRNRLASVVITVCLAACGGDDTEPRSGDVVSSAPFVHPSCQTLGRLQRFVRTAEAYP